MKKITYKEALIGDESKIERVVDVAAGVIVKKGPYGEDMLLLIQRHHKDHWPGVWEFPRGKCDKPIGESLTVCCQREIKEETGLDVMPKFEIDTYEYIADHGTRKSICHNFYCEIVDEGQKIKLSKEHQDYKWVTSVGQIELILHPDQKKTIQKVFNRDIMISNIPDNEFTKNNTVEEYLDVLQGKK